MGSSEDEKWKRLRAVVTPTFSAGKLRLMKPFIDDTIRTLLGSFDSTLKHSNVVNVKHYFGAFTMDTVIQVCILKNYYEQDFLRLISLLGGLWNQGELTY